MPLKPIAERRRAFRAILEGERLVHPGSVFDAVSARLAQAAGYEVGLVGGSVLSHLIVGAPDIVLMTLTELVEQTRRITRGSDLPLLVDADHGYGNALNVMRTVLELEMAGVAALTIEDTDLPRPHGGKGALITVEEFRDKLRAAVEARTDASLGIIGRTGALAIGLEETLKRVQAMKAAGVDAVFVFGAPTLEQVDAVAAATSLPIVLNTMVASAEELSARSVRVVNQGHQPYFVAMQALYESYLHIRGGGPMEALREKWLSPELQAIALDEAEYARRAREFLGP
jgi:carboxyvinyl-carboxyphosphonate phosphorylmutase